MCTVCELTADNSSTDQFAGGVRAPRPQESTYKTLGATAHFTQPHNPSTHSVRLESLPARLLTSDCRPGP